MNDKILEQIEVGENEIIVLIGATGDVIGSTNDVNQIPLIIKEEYCADSVEINQVYEHQIKCVTNENGESSTIYVTFQTTPFYFSNEVENAKKVLSDNGYFTGNLWQVEDVQSKYKCNTEEAQEVLEQALTNDATMNQVWFAIDHHAEENNIIEYIDGLFSINGYFKDDKSEFNGYLVYEYDSVSEGLEDENIFYYGLSESSIIEAIKEGENTGLEFVITDYERAI